MRVTKAIVREFERDQEDHGTAVALSNLLWRSATDQLTELGATRVRTSYERPKA